MGHGVFIHRADSIYEDSPSKRYHFPAQYLNRASACVGDWIFFYEPVKVRGSRGYFAAAKVERIIPDPPNPSMHFALIEPGTYLDFDRPVSFNGSDGPIERGLLNESGRISGRAQSAVRPISAADFGRIVDQAMRDEGPLLPRLPISDGATVRDDRTPFVFERDPERSLVLTSRLVRDRIFRKRVLQAYGERCAITGFV